MNRLILPISFFVLSPFLLFLSCYLLLSLSQPQISIPIPPPPVLGASTEYFSENALFTPSYSISVGTSDARKHILSKYLNRFSSPLAAYADQIITISDNYGLDYRLLVAIAQQESNLCKRIPEGSYNCWGFGIYGDKVTRFDNYLQAMETVARVLRRDYLNRGLHTPDQIMAKYTPPSLKKGGSWAKGVNQFLFDLE